MNFKITKEKGITLIALIITIIVLLILAGISIATLTGENGMLKKVAEANEKTARGEAEEGIKLVLNEWKIEKNQSQSKTLEEFLESKVETTELSNVEKKDNGTFEVEKNGYIGIVNSNGELVGKVEKATPRPEIKNIKVKKIDGSEIEEKGVEIGTKLQISFDVSIQGGEITSVETEKNENLTLNNGKVTYITDGQEKSVEFEITGEVGENTYIKKKKISIANKYIKPYESLEKAVQEIQENGKNKIRISAQNNVIMHEIDAIVYDNDLVLDGINNINGAELENKIYRFGDIADVATKTENAKSTVLLKVKGNLTINEGVTLTTCKSADGYGGPKGFLIYCTGTITNNGEISMTDKGAKAEGEDVFLYKNGNDQYEYVPATGAKGGKPVSAWTHYMHIKGEHYETINESSPGLKGEDGTNRKTGGGASGAASAWGATTTGMSTWAYSGKGGKGTSYSGGNDGQSVATSATGKTITGNSGTEIGGNAGGLLIIFANSIQNTGKITSNGVKGIYNNGTGGGSINIFYKRDITQGTIEAKGGIGNDSNGGDGSVTIKHIEDLDLK